MPTEDILTALHGLDNAPWGDLKGEPLNARALARILGQYQTADGQPIESAKVKTDGRPLQGYRAADLHDAWTRYLPPPAETEPPEPAEPPSSQAMIQVPEALTYPEPAEPDPEPPRRRAPPSGSAGSGTGSGNGTSATLSDLQGSAGSGGSAFPGPRRNDPESDPAIASKRPRRSTAKHTRQGRTPNQEAHPS